MIDTDNASETPHATPHVVMVAPNGARKTKADHPSIPIGPAELAETALACHEVGAAAIHLHVRDANEAHSLDVDLYREALGVLRRKVGERMVVQVTTEAVGRYTPMEQMACVDALGTELTAISIAVRELFSEPAAEGEVEAFLRRHDTRGTGIQFICYDRGDVDWFLALRDRGMIPERFSSLLFVLGRYTRGQRSTPSDLLSFLHPQLTGIHWMVCAFGALEGACALTSAALGGHSRLGFENNLLLASGDIAPDNAALVAQLVKTLPVTGRALAGVDTARRVLGCA
ncbi:MAG: 3-keto-5-aminohexanoate cleavage protein [Azospirillaceae bacterium]